MSAYCLVRVKRSSLSWSRATFWNYINPTVLFNQGYDKRYYLTELIIFQRKFNWYLSFYSILKSSQTSEENGTTDMFHLS
jgi:hypothetical protein